ncbi:MAG: PAS domain-containing protein [Ferrovibrio sp.]|uniref:PAS domain-containing protein n=1 Tax=Ferrovibrio sp. TaxID=1917215 RepID=UPI0026252545|nr:PAS domain-containing protein [Ferrovibrio sp.]MCW0235578.1 PAS domain-containing protein [Ferrovibrio sp.]
MALTQGNGHRPDLSTFTHVKDPRLVQLLAYYLDQRQGRRVPRRNSISPLDFPTLLGNVFLYEYDAGNDDLCIRLAGEDIRAMLLTTKQGAKLSEVFPADVVPIMRERYSRVLADCAVMHNIGRVFHHMGGTGTGERLVLPLLDESDRPRFLLGATVYGLDRDSIHPAPNTVPQVITYTPL